MRVAIDLSHSQAWNADRDSLAHLGGIVGELPGCDATVRTIDGPWRPDTLDGTGLLLLPVSGRDGDRPFTADETAALTAFVGDGGAVLAFGDGAAAPLTPDDAITSAVAPFGLGTHFLSEPRADATHVLAHDVVGTPVRDQPRVADVEPLVAGVGAVRAPRTRPVLTDGGDLVPVLCRATQTIAAAATRGAGRVVVVGNAELFTLAYLGHRDNLRFLLNVFSWLATGGVTPAERQQVEKVLADRTFHSGSGDEREDLTLVAGGHLVDAAPHRDAVERVGGAALPDPYAAPEEFLAEAALRFHELPRPIREAVGRFGHGSNEYGVLLVRGLPVGRNVPPTPADAHSRPRKDEWLGELWLAAFASALGTPFAYLQEQSGTLYQNVVPTPGNATKLSSESSAILLGFHTEMGFHPYPPDHVLLMCLRPDHDGVSRTITAGVRMVLRELTVRQRAVLSEPLFRPGIDYSFGSPNGTEGNGPALAVLYGDPHDPCLNFDFDLMVGLTEEAAEALRALRVAAGRVQRWVRLTTGDLLVIDNRRAAHARSEFTARYDGQDRWLQRMCVIRDLQPAAADRRGGGRVIETVFAT